MDCAYYSEINPNNSTWPPQVLDDDSLQEGQTPYKDVMAILNCLAMSSHPFYNHITISSNHVGFLKYVKIYEIFLASPWIPQANQIQSLKQSRMLFQSIYFDIFTKQLSL